MKFLLPIVLYLFIAGPVWGAVVPDNVAATAGEGADTYTISNFAVAATSPLILCSAGVEEFQSVTGVTYNGISMTPVGSELSQDSGNSFSLWRLTGQSGTHDVVVTYSAITGNVAITCSSFTGADQTTPLGSPQTSFDFASLPISITVPAGGLAFDTVAALDGSGGCSATLTTTGGNTEITGAEICDDGGLGSSGALISASTRSTTGTMEWDFVSGAYTLQIGVPINPATTAAASLVTRRR